MKATVIVFLATLACARAPIVADSDSTPASFSFEDVAVGELPQGWTADATDPKGSPNPWQVLADDAAPSGVQVLALPQVESFHNGTFNLCWTEDVRFLDGEIEVQVKADSGVIDQGGGPIWRVLDGDNYYIARWNPLEDNFRVYHVKDGRRTQIATARTDADPDAWHSIKILHRGAHIEAFLDGELICEVEDSTFTAAGGVGLWTKADAATRFDDFQVSE